MKKVENNATEAGAKEKLNPLKEYHLFQNSTVRLYGKVVQEWSVDSIYGSPIVQQVELSYTDYNIETGEVIGEGTEDFSAENYSRLISQKFVWVWDGKKRNQGGKRWFDVEGTIKIKKNDKKNAVRLLHKHWYPNAAVVELR